jgi:hypothetical protein
MSHHYSYPDSMFPHGDARLDLCLLKTPSAAEILIVTDPTWTENKIEI